jgi:coenzyme F420-reducing hydrogenase alpha subunit
MSSAHAIENAFGAKVDGQLRLLRRLIYCGEWIESHALHVYMLHAPDFLGYQDAIQMAKDHASVVRRGLQLKKAGHEIVNAAGRKGKFIRLMFASVVSIKCRRAANWRPWQNG